MTKEWVIEQNSSTDRIAAFAKELNISTGIASILINRGITDFELAKTFFRPTLEQLHDPFLMKDMDRAVNRLSEAIFNEEKILIYGDYDVDGTTSVALVYRFLKNFSGQLGCYIPDRYKEGYGISLRGVQFAKDNEYSLMISLDCGIRAMEQASFAKSIGVDLIICDHHLPDQLLPDAYAILDPKRNDCLYPYKELSGCGVGFKLMQGFCLQNSIEEEKLFQTLDLLAVSIASDIVPITGENRVLAYFGLKKVNHSPSAGIKALINVGGLKKDLTISNLVFGIGPRINAAGRIGHAEEAVRLLVAENVKEAEVIAENINQKNAERKELDKSITEEAIEMIESDIGLKESSTTVLYKDDWHKGVIGIVASRCIEKYYKPTIILTSSNNKLTGSARSVDGFDIHEAISDCSELLEQFGGHKYAAGLTLEEKNLDAFKQKFENVVSGRIKSEQLKPKLLIDGEIKLSDLTFKFQNVLQQMAPFGPHNSEPVFVSKNLCFKGSPRLLKEAHIKMTVLDPETNKNIEAIAFGFGDLYEELLNCEVFDLAYHLSVNEFMGNKSLQLMIKDINLH